VYFQLKINKRKKALFVETESLPFVLVVPYVSFSVFSMAASVCFSLHVRAVNFRSQNIRGSSEH
jgi:hypothetical protein